MKKKDYTLITGTSGFIGRKVLNLLKKKNINILASYKENKIQKTRNINPIKFDIKNFKYETIKKFSIKSLIHLAWPNLDDFNDISHQKSILIQQKKFLKKIIENGCKNLIISGTCYEYGLINGKIKESTKTKPISSYGKGKDSLRKYIFQLQKKYKFKLTWLRIFFIYGINPRRKTLTNILIKSKKNRKVIVLNSKIERDYLDVDFVADTFVKILFEDKNFGIINLCSGKKIPLKSLVHILKRKFKITPKVTYENTDQRYFEPEKFYGCNLKLKKIFK